MSLSSPVAFFIFNRPDLTAISFEAIARARPPKLFVIADGPRSREESARCEEARAIINRVDWDCEVATDFSDTNLGCKRRVHSGIDWVFSQVDASIFLEDDCLPAPSFFSFCQSLLERYSEDERIMHISGGSFLFDEIKLPHSYYFSRYSFGGYGWASWKRAWKHYDPDMRSWPEFKHSGIIESIFDDHYEQEYWRDILDRTYMREIDTWDFQWFYTCWLQSGLSIVPAKNLVSNLGFRPDATHTNTPYERSYLANVPRGSMDRIIHPEFMVRNREADSHTFDIYFGRNNLDQRITLRKRAFNYLAAIRQRVRKLKVEVT